jgi:hypothetical protein
MRSTSSSVAPALSEDDSFEFESEAETELGPVRGFADFDQYGNESEDSLLRKRMITTLLIYPRISPSMMQVAIGPHHKPYMWRPVLESLIKEGVIERLQESRQSERGRWRTLIILQLSKAALKVDNELKEDEQEHEQEQEHLPI